MLGRQLHIFGVRLADTFKVEPRPVRNVPVVDITPTPAAIPVTFGKRKLSAALHAEAARQDEARRNGRTF